MTRHPKALTTVLIIYIASLVAIKGQYVNEPPSVTNTALQLATACTFALVGGILALYGGGLDAWPAIIPLAFVQAVVHMAYVFVKSISVGQSTIARFDPMVSVASIIMTTALLLYAIIPPSETWARHLGILAFVLFGLPLAFVLPSLLRGRSNQHMSLVRAAAHVSLSVYTRERSDLYREVEFITDQTTGARCGVYVDRDNTIYVAFAGSDSKVDWVRTNIAVSTQAMDIECLQEKPLVHKGFLDAWRSIRERVWNKVSDIMLRQAGSGKIVVCGHSLGGAMASLASMDMACVLESQYKQSLAVITFGSPRVGDIAFQTLFDKTIPVSVRVTTVYDPVPKLVINDFVHVKGEYVVTAPFENLVTSHMPQSYIRALEKEGSYTGLVFPVVGSVVALAWSSMVAMLQNKAS